MSLVMVDTSVWIDFFAGRDTHQVQTLEQLIQANHDLALCGIILTEVLQGVANDTQYKTLRDYLAPLIRLDIHEAIWLSAADIYRQLRSKGITIRKTNDCVIAATALHYDCLLLHNDRDFDAIRQHYALRIPEQPLH